MHEGALQSLIHGADESVVDVVEPEEESLGDESFAMNHHPALYEEHDQATNSDVHLGLEHLGKHKPRFDSDEQSPWPSKSHLFHEDEDDDAHFSHLHSDEVHHGKGHIDDVDVDADTLYKQVKPRLDSKDSHHVIGFEEANSIHGADSDSHPHEGEHPFTEHYPISDNDSKDNDDLIDKHHRNLYIHDDDSHHVGQHNDKVILSKATNFKTHSGGVEEEVASINDKESHQNAHKEDIHTIDQDTVAEITNNVVKAVMKAKYSKKSKLSKRSKMAKRGRNEIRKRTIHNLYVCECPPGFLGAHCQRKS